MDSLMDLAIQKVNEKSLPVFEMAYCDMKKNIVHNFVPASSHPIYSLSKNFVAATFANYKLHHELDLNMSIYDVFHNTYKDMSIAYKKVSIANVLTQTTGINQGFLDIDQEDMSKYGNDYLSYVLHSKLPFEAGSHFQYSDSNYYLASQVLAFLSKKPYKDLLKESILDPLHIVLTNKSLCDTHGDYMGATGLYMSSLDVAKLGYAFINDGVFEGQQILDSNFVKEALKPLVKVDCRTAYGYSFWTNIEKDVHYGNGMYSQLLYLSKEGYSIAFLADSRLGSCHELEELFV
jgi:CubicO group peptidase (beta-lactamase class C family)